jgi:phytanoyl-CoA hydroxylase
VPGLARLARDPRLAALAAEALGCARVQLLQDSLLYKPAGEGGSVHWHQDHTYVGFLSPPRVVSLRLALLPEREASGCLRVVDGSHRWGPIGDLSALTATRVDSLLPSLSDAQRDAVAAARPVELAPGDVSIHHCLTLHGSGPNRDAGPRKTVILRMFDAACRLDASRLPAAARGHFPVEPDGSLSAAVFPVVHG